MEEISRRLDWWYFLRVPLVMDVEEFLELNHLGLVLHGPMLILDAGEWLHAVDGDMSEESSSLVEWCCGAFDDDLLIYYPCTSIRGELRDS